MVNGSTGIAVGMATNMAPHNLVEVIQALRHLIAHPNTDIDGLMRFVPGPDLPTGGKIIGLDGIRDAYETGRGSFRMRATARVETVGRRKGIVVTEMPYAVGLEKVVERIKVLVQGKKLQGISDVKDLTDMANGMRLVIEVKNGFVPEAILEQLYRLTPMEESFGINNVCLVDGQPRTLGPQGAARGLPAAPLRRRTPPLAVPPRQEGRPAAPGRRPADRAARHRRGHPGDPHQRRPRRRARAADVGLRPVRSRRPTTSSTCSCGRLTRFSRIELEKEQETLRREIEELEAILADEALLRKVVSDELAEVAKTYGTPRRTVLLESAGTTVTATQPLRSRSPTTRASRSVVLSGLLARTSSDEPLGEGGGRANHDVVVSAVPTTARGEVGLVTRRGRLLKLSVLDLPGLPASANDPNLQGGYPVSELASLEPGERALALSRLATDGPGLAIGTRHGTVKRVNPEVLGRDEWEVIRLDDGDEVVGAVEEGWPPAPRRSASSPPTPSCCTSAPRRSGRRAAPAVASPASASPPASGSPGSARCPATTTSWSPRRAPRPPCPAPSRVRSR